MMGYSSRHPPRQGAYGTVAASQTIALKEGRPDEMLCPTASAFLVVTVCCSSGCAGTFGERAAEIGQPPSRFVLFALLLATPGRLSLISSHNSKALPHGLGERSLTERHSRHRLTWHAQSQNRRLKLITARSFKDLACCLRAISIALRKHSSASTVGFRPWTWDCSVSVPCSRYSSAS